MNMQAIRKQFLYLSSWLLNIKNIEIESRAIKNTDKHMKIFSVKNSNAVKLLDRKTNNEINTDIRIKIKSLFLIERYLFSESLNNAMDLKSISKFTK